jgi:hypothetical protein
MPFTVIALGGRFGRLLWEVGQPGVYNFRGVEATMRLLDADNTRGVPFFTSFQAMRKGCHD